VLGSFGAAGAVGAAIDGNGGALELETLAAWPLEDSCAVSGDVSITCLSDLFF